MVLLVISGLFQHIPLKNLNACGDGGFVVSNNKKLSDFIKLKKKSWSFNKKKIKFFGTVSRLDSLQAVILNFRLKRLEKVINKRLKNASIYKKKLKSLEIYHPNERKDCRDTYHLFVIQLKKEMN